MIRKWKPANKVPFSGIFNIALYPLKSVFREYFSLCCTFVVHPVECDACALFYLIYFVLSLLERQKILNNHSFSLVLVHIYVSWNVLQLNVLLLLYRWNKLKKKKKRAWWTNKKLNKNWILNKFYWVVSYWDWIS